MLKELRIRNFKCWEDTGAIRMAPITLFFGVNSSGKSSIGQFLMMLKQTVESPDTRAVFYPGDRNAAVNLGTYAQMVFHRDPKRAISFDYKWKLPESLRVKDVVSDKSFRGDVLAFEAKVGLQGKEEQTLGVFSFQYEIFDGKVSQFALGMERKPGSKTEYQVNCRGFDLRRTRGRPWPPGSPVRFYGFPDEVVAYYQNADFVKELNLRHEKLHRSFFYLGPLRTKPERLYTWSGIEPESVGYAGENTIAAMLASYTRTISLGYRQKGNPFQEIIASCLKKMDLIDQFRVDPISKERQEYEAKIRVRKSADWVDLPDVGFGISQVLPVLVQCFYAPPNSIILMEQPEIHLHPSAQSALADVMIDVIQSRENGKNRNIQLIIETHSEHFLRRLQRRIAEDVLTKDQVAAYFANIEKTPPMLEALQMDEYGNIVNWPKNFFGDDMGEIARHAEAAIKKRMKKRKENAEASE